MSDTLKGTSRPKATPTGASGGRARPRTWGNEASLAAGRLLRASVPRSAHADWSPPPGRPDPVGLLVAQDHERVPELVALRHKRMLASPFAFLRGAAVVMAHDLAATPTTGLQVQACGDAHLANFGVYGTPERNLIFDINDFDETLPAPWEWDLKRLAASFVVAGRTYGHTAAQTSGSARACAASYRTHLRRLATMGYLDVWYERVDAAAVTPILAPTRREAERAIRRTRQETNERELPRLTELVEGIRRIADRPPLLVHLRQGDTPETLEGMQDLLTQYRRSLDPERRVLLDRYRLVDAARKVVGVGSVGTRCAVALFLGASDADPLFLQVKEAQASVLEAVLAPSPFTNHAERVVRGQRLVQAASDWFLGWVRGADGRDYSIRQLRDMKHSVNTQTLSPDQMTRYARSCGWALARAHARAGDAAAIAAYLGSGSAFDMSLARFATAYADQTQQDYTALMDAAHAGHIEVARSARPGTTSRGEPSR